MIKVAIRCFRRILFLAAFASCAAMFFSAEARAATYAVDTTADNAALTACTSAPNDCSLRGAITKANGTTANDTINFSFPANGGDPGCDFVGCAIVFSGGRNGELEINSTATAGNLTITNSTGNSIFVSGNNQSRVFYLNPGANLSLNRIIVTNGNAAAAGIGGAGGGIYNDGGTLTLTNTTVRNNTAAGFGGGGIYNDNGTLTVTNSIVTGNTTPWDGGGIYSRGTLMLTNSTVSENTTPRSGGGIFNGCGAATLTNSTVSGNTAESYGGGFYNDSSACTSSSIMTATNSTVSGNAGSFSGGIYNAGSSTLNLTSVTVTNNRSTGTTSVCNGICPGGISNNGTANLKNTIVAGNTATSGTRPPDFHGTISPTSSYNIIGSNQGMTGITNGANGNQVGTPENLINPRLAPLADNGGPTQTHRLLESSRAIDAGSSFGLAADQRGLSRTVDLSNYPNAGDGTDIGAFEAQTAPITATVDTTADNQSLTACTSAPNDCSLRGAVSIANQSNVNNTIDFNIPAGDIGCANNVCTINLANNELAINSAATAGNLTITNAGGANEIAISGNNNYRVFYLYLGANLAINNVTVTRGRGVGFNAQGVNGNGGAIYSNGALTLIDSTVSNSTAIFAGGGIYSDGSLLLLNSTVSGNTTQNRAGGILNGGAMTLTNSTVSGNAAPQEGGIYNSGTLNLSSVTVTNNRSSNINICPACAGGIVNNAGTASFDNTIVAGNTVANSANSPDFNGTISSARYNLLGNNQNAFGIADGANGNQVGTPGSPIDPRLDILFDYGGPTRTHRLLDGSPALDRGSRFGLNADQRGMPRPIDLSLSANADDAADIGAFEAQTNPFLMMTGIVSYGTTPAGQPAKYVANVTIFAQTTDGSSTAATAANGFYAISNLKPASDYTVTPSKTGQINGITAFDATLVLRCVAAGTSCVLTENQRLAADANASNSLTAFDATQILRFVAAGAQTAATGQVGGWKFNPISRAYLPLDASMQNQNYEAILIGEVNGSWTP